MARKRLTGFGVRLKALREAAGLTQQQLATRVNLSLSGIAHIEQGLREPAWGTAIDIAAALGVPCTEFIGDRQHPAQV